MLNGTSHQQGNYRDFKFNSTHQIFRTNQFLLDSGSGGSGRIEYAIVAITRITTYEDVIIHMLLF